MLLAEERAELVHYGRRLIADGLAVGTAGNLSVRRDDLLAVTPSALAYEELTPELVCVVSWPDGTQVDGPLRPASELELHLRALAATGLDAVVHTHSPAATAVACLVGVDELPCLHYYLAMFGGALPVTGYAPYGTSTLADLVGRALTDRTGCLLGQHGAVAVGATLAQAYDKARIIEWLADVYLRARAVGPVRTLTAQQIDDVVLRLQGYGQRPPAG